MSREKDSEADSARAKTRASTERAVRDAHAALEASSRRLNEVRQTLGLKTARYRVVLEGDSTVATPAPTEVFDSPALAITLARERATSLQVSAAVIEVGSLRVACRAGPDGALSRDGVAITAVEVVQRERNEHRKV